MRGKRESTFHFLSISSLLFGFGCALTNCVLFLSKDSTVKWIFIYSGREKASVAWSVEGNGDLE